MGEEVEKIRSPYGLESVNCFGVTDIKQDIFSFRWDIKRFRERLQNKDKGFVMKSPLYDFGEERNKLQWQLQIFWSKKEKRTVPGHDDEFLSIFLSVANWRQPVKVSFQFDLLNVDRSWKRSATDYEFNSPLDDYGYEKFAKVSELLDPNNKLLEDDTLKIYCRIVMKRDTVHQVKGMKTEVEKQADKRKHDLVSDYTNLFNCKTLADVSIKTKNTTLTAHKAVLSCRSPVFAAMFQNQMYESINNIVNIIDFNDEVVKGMLEYIYCGEISQDFLMKKCGELLKIAEKYDVRGLKREAAEVIGSNLCVKNVADSLILADMNNAMDLKAKAIEFFNMNRVEAMKTKGFEKMLSYNPSIFKELYGALGKDDSGFGASQTE